MTGKNLPPTTGREISGLKRRVTDLERVLDRLRRRAANQPGPVLDTPYAEVVGGRETMPAGATVLAPNRSVVADPTGYIAIDEDDSDGWSFVLRKPGYYEIGGTVRFIDNECVDASDRWLSIVPSDAYGNFGEWRGVLRVGRAAGGSLLSGSRMVHDDQRTHTRWHLAAGHDDDHAFDVSCDAFWVRFITSGKPSQTVGEV